MDRNSTRFCPTGFTLDTPELSIDILYEKITAKIIAFRNKDMIAKFYQFSENNRLASLSIGLMAGILMIGNWS
ncbi:MAG TPA: hypothetical protein VFV38_34750 [Ktedonobacteraceae bacterium]|nr:hypothetical protein [Ktedonobacteraceae bacterium]